MNAQIADLRKRLQLIEAAKILAAQSGEIMRGEETIKINRERKQIEIQLNELLRRSHEAFNDINDTVIDVRKRA